ncbi:conserved hypothetical protein [Aeropyrum pernix]|uniref:DUF5615 domain-containing protein n=1 Tax=Aeropyrum pernix TaxID=56636 RepID=A0A401H9N5_AERPX|nr:DUF5615 family PIN-like protein [Aeropyrum pernix]GBF09062.1 conserved hypothetical protein [Aeropyrum pernix]
MLKLLADENIPKRLVRLLHERGVNVIRLQDLRARGISDREVIKIANRLGRVILTRDQDFTMPNLLSLVEFGVIYISYQPSKEEILDIADRIATLTKEYEPKPSLLVIVTRDYTEIYG